MTITKISLILLLLPILTLGVLFNDTTKLSISTPQVVPSPNIANFELFGDTLLQSYHLCSNLTATSSNNQYVQEYNMARCMLPLFNSLRLRKVLNLHNLSLTFNPFGYHQGQVWSLLSLLNHFERVDENGVRRCFCLLGDYIAPHILITILSFPTVNQVLLFNTNTAHKQKQPPSFSPLYPELELVVIAAGKILRELPLTTDDAIDRSQQGQCDAILLLPSYIQPDNTITLRYLSLLMKDSQSPILWLSPSSADGQTSLGNRQSLLSWRLTSTWNTISAFNEAEDHNGFLAKSYDFDSMGDFSITTVYLGYLSPPAPPPPPVPAEPKSEEVIVIIITYTIRVFADTAFGLQTKLTQQLRYDHVFVLLELSYETMLFLESQYPSPSHRLLQIAIAPHDITPLLYDRYIVYHMEQDWSIVTSGTSQLHYDHILRHALAVWTFSTRQQQHLLKRGIHELQAVHIVPVDTISRQSISTADNSNKGSNDKFDMIFFGSSSNRRMIMINDLYSRVHTIFNLNVFVGDWKTCIFDEDRDIVVKRATLALNLQAHQQSVLEVHRISYLLSMGKCVLSERGSDAILAKQFEAAVIFVDSIEDVQEKMTRLLSNPEARRACEEKARLEFIRMSNESKDLKYAMNKAVEKILIRRGV